MLKLFCENTSLHGFAYLVQPSSHRIEKIFWLLSVITASILTGVLIRKLILDTQNNPIVIYKDQNIEKIETMNFPAVTICPGMIYKSPCETHIDYPNVKEQLLNHELNITYLDMKDLKKLQLVSLVARDSFMADNFPSLEIPMDDYMDVYNEFNQGFATHYTVEYVNLIRPLNHIRVHNFFGSYGGKYALLMKKLAVQYGPCFTMNNPNPNEFYDVNVTDPDLYQGNVTELFGHLKNDDSGGLYQMEIAQYPLNASMRNFELSCHLSSRPCLEKVFKELTIFEHFVPDKETEGFHVILHDPYEVISSSASHFIWGYDDRMELSITPEVTKIDDSLIDEEPEYRNCYLPHEKDLKFFKVYNKANCEHECWSQMTLEACGCVQYFMARNMTTKVCGTNKEHCFRKIEKFFEDERSRCKCYDPCDNIKFDIQLVSTEHYKKTDRFGIKISASFSVDSVFATRRKLSYTAVDFLSFVGGLFGLFAGFSFLSGVEILYYFLLVPVIKIQKKRTSKVYPVQTVTEQSTTRLSRAKDFLKSMLESSSVHSFNIIGSDGKTMIERLIWLVMFLSSMLLACVMTKEVYQAFRNKQIIMKYGSNVLDVSEIPLPALTIVRGIVIWIPSEYFREKYNDYNYSYLQKVDFEMQNHVKAYKLKSSLEYQRPEDFVEYLMACAVSKRKNPFYVFEATMNQARNLSFAYVVTPRLMGITYNMMEQSKLLRNDTISKAFRYLYGTNDSSDYPLKASKGHTSGLVLDYNSWSVNKFSWADESFLVHSPDELPGTGTIEGLKISKTYDIFVSPEVIQADDDLKSLDVDIRQCYFEGERKLKYFKIYTQKNCEMECLSHIVNSICTCVPFYYIRGPNMSVCNQYSTVICVQNIESLRASDYDHLYSTHGVCKCLQPCSYVRYSYTVIRREFYKFYNIKRNIITMKWKDSDYFPMVRFQEYKLTDFFSFFGGILGLFAGISVLSVFEIFYFLTLRLATDFVRNYRH